MTGRIAPPTGGLHRVTPGLFSWLALCEVSGRTLILRIEDLDASRVKPGATQGAIDDLLWLGFDWDEGPFVRSSAWIYTSRVSTGSGPRTNFPRTWNRAKIADRHQLLTPTRRVPAIRAPVPIEQPMMRPVCKGACLRGGSGVPDGPVAGTTCSRG